MTDGAPPSPSPSPPRRTYVVDVVSRGLGRVGRDRTTTTLTLFAFLIAKVLLVTHGDLLTSMALINDAGLVPVTIGVIMSLIPIASALAMAAAIYGRTCGRWCWDKPARQWAVIAGVVFVSAWFSPWYLFVPAVVASALLGVFDRERDEALPTMRSRAGRGFLVLATTGVIYAVGATLFTMWLPHEELTLRDTAQPRIGYVVGEKGGWVNMLTSGKRRIVRIPSSAVEKRVLCRGSDFHESPIQWTARRLGHPTEYLDRCGEAPAPAA